MKDIKYIIVVDEGCCAEEASWTEVESDLTLEEAIKLRDINYSKEAVYIVADV